MQVRLGDSVTAFKTVMSSTSQKHKDFVAEPMGEKPVMALAGIGEVLGKRLEEKGFDKVNMIYKNEVFRPCVQTDVNV